MQNKWKPVEGKTPTKREMATWDSAHFIHFIRFCEHFIEWKEDGAHISVTRERWRSAEGFLPMPDHPFHEFLWRINRFSFDKSNSEKKFQAKFTSMMRFILGYLRENPVLVSDEMRKIIEPNARLNWCLKSTDVVATPVGPVVVPSQDPNAKSIAGYEQRFIQTIEKAAGMAEMLLDIPMEDIKKMSPKDRLMAAARMAPFLNMTKNFKPGKQVFKQINIHGAGREELEAAMLAMNKDED